MHSPLSNVHCWVKDSFCQKAIKKKRFQDKAPQAHKALPSALPGMPRVACTHTHQRNADGPLVASARTAVSAPSTSVDGLAGSPSHVQGRVGPSRLWESMECAPCRRNHQSNGKFATC